MPKPLPPILGPWAYCRHWPCPVPEGEDCGGCAVIAECLDFSAALARRRREAHLRRLGWRWLQIGAWTLLTAGLALTLLAIVLSAH